MPSFGLSWNCSFFQPRNFACVLSHLGHLHVANGDGVGTRPLPESTSAFDDTLQLFIAALRFYFISFQNFVMSSLTLSHPFSLAQFNKVSQSCSRFLPSVSLDHLPSLFSYGVNFLPFRVPRFHVLFENVPNSFLLEPSLFQQNFSIVANLFQHPKAIGQLNPVHLVHFVLTLFFRLSADVRLCSSFFEAQQPCSFFDVHSCFHETLCHIFPPRLHFSFLWPIVLETLRLSPQKNSFVMTCLSSGE